MGDGSLLTETCRNSKNMCVCVQTFINRQEDQLKKQQVVTPEMWAAEFKEGMNSDRAKQFMLELVTKDNKWIDKFEKAGAFLYPLLFFSDSFCPPFYPSHAEVVLQK